MPQEYFRQANFTNGALDPEMIGRREIKSYFASLAVAENTLQSPQGPINRRPGHAYVGRVRNPLTPIDLTHATITCPNGGDPSKLLVAGDNLPVTTTPLSLTNPYVVFQIDLGTEMLVSAIDVVDFAVVAAGGTGSGAPPIVPPIPILPWGFPFGGGFYL